MTLEDIVTNRTRLSEDILAEVLETAAGYGVRIQRADVKDLIFPGNLQEIMNKVLAAERTSEAQLVEARTKAQTQQIDAQARAQVQQVEAETQASIVRATYQRRRGHPVLFSRAVFADLRRADPAVGAKAVVRARAAEVVDVDVPDAAVIVDVDSPEDVSHALRWLRRAYHHAERWDAKGESTDG